MLLGINGRLGAGKDTAAGRIRAIVRRDVAVETYAFARPLKVSAAAVFGLSLEELEGLKLNEGYTIQVVTPERVVMLTGRQYLERYGTEAHRNVFGQGFWLNQGLPLGYDHTEGITLFTDCRFPNEAQRVRDCGGYIVEIVGTGPREGNGHPSDRPLPQDLIDFAVDNTTRGDDFARLDEQLRLLLGDEYLLETAT